MRCTGTLYCTFSCSLSEFAHVGSTVLNVYHLQKDDQGKEVLVFPGLIDNCMQFTYLTFLLIALLVDALSFQPVVELCCPYPGQYTAALHPLNN